MTGDALTTRDPDLDKLARLGTWLQLSESGKEDPTAKGAAAALRLYYAEQLGLPPLAVAELSVINGRLFVSAQLLRALAERAGYRVERRDDSDMACTAVLFDQENRQRGAATFTIEEAKRAGLIRDRSAWKTHPARMLWARASKNVIQDFAPSVALGLALDDEADEYLGKLKPEPEPTFGNTVAGEPLEPEEDVPWPDVEEAEWEPSSEPYSEKVPEPVAASEEYPVPEAVRRYREQQAAKEQGE